MAACALLRYLLLSLCPYFAVALHILNNGQHQAPHARALPPTPPTLQLAQSSPSDQPSLNPGNSPADQLLSEISSGDFSKVTTSIIDTPAGNALNVVCNSALFGGGLEARSCFDSLSQCPTGDTQESWAYVNSLPAGSSAEVSLPVVKLGDDAACYITPVLVHNRQSGGIIGHASAKNVTDAARAVIQQCVIPRRIGGVANMIGGDNRIKVLVGLNTPKVRCLSQPLTATPNSCRYIIERMAKHSKKERFGHFYTPGQHVDVATPLVMKSHGHCQITIDNALYAVDASWNDVWLAVESLVAVCVRAGKKGEALVTSMAAPHMRGLYVKIEDEPAPSGTVSATGAVPSETDAGGGGGGSDQGSTGWN